MLTFLRFMNVMLILAMIGCAAGALAGLIVLLPFVGGAWALNLALLTAYEEHERPGWIARLHAGVDSDQHRPQEVRGQRDEHAGDQARRPVEADARLGMGVREGV